MAALTDKLQQVAVAGSQTTMAAPGKAYGASSFNITSPSGWPTATGITVGVRRVDSNGNYVAGTYTEWEAVLSGSTLTINTVPSYGTDPAGGYAADGLTQVFIPVSATLWNNLITALLLDHAENGGHNTLHDLNGNTLLGITAIASAVNSLILNNQVTGSGPSLVAQGSDSNIDMNTGGKGTGRHYVDGVAPLPLSAGMSGLPWVESGCVISNPSGLNWAMTAGVVWVNGKRYNVPAQSSTAAIASKDTYIDVLVGSSQNSSSQSITVNAVTNNTSSPALAANSIRIGIVVAGASTIGFINQGQTDSSLSGFAPVISSVSLTHTDTNGNIIYPRDPSSKLLGYRQRITDLGVIATGGSDTAVSGLVCPVNVPLGRKVKITVYNPSFFNTSGPADAYTNIYDGTIGSGGVKLNEGHSVSSSANYPYCQTVQAIQLPAASAKTYTVGVRGAGAGTGVNTTGVAATEPFLIMVELY